MLKRTRGIVATLVLAFLCTSILSTGMVQEDIFASAASTKEPLTGNRFLAVEAEVRNISEGMISFYDEETEKFGFFDQSGQVAIPAEYYGVGIFSEGLAPAGVTPYAYGYIDYTGQFIIPPLFNWALDFHEGKAIVNSGKEGSRIIDTSGSFLLEKSYDSIFYDTALKLYFAYDGKSTEVMDSQCALLYRVPYCINSVYQVDGRSIGTIWGGNGTQYYGAIDIATGKVLVIEEGSGYTIIQNGFLVLYSEPSQSTNIYSMKDGTLLSSFGMENAYPINQNTFYTEIDGISYLLKNGIQNKVDYRLYTEILPGLLLVATNPEEGRDTLYGVMNSNGDLLLPITYDYIYGDYRSYMSGVQTPRVFLTRKGNTCEVYDTKLNKIAEYHSITNVGFTEGFYYLVDFRGFTTVLDGSGQILDVIDTGGRGVVSGWGHVLSAYREESEPPCSYVYLDETAWQRPDYSYAPDPASPVALSSSEIEALLAGLPSKTEGFFMTSKFVKKDTNGDVFLHNDWAPKPEIIDGFTYIHPVELSDAFYSFGYRTWPQKCEMYYQDKALTLTYGKKEARLSYYDMEKQMMAAKTILLQVPVRGADASNRTDYYDSASIIPLRAAAEALSLYVSWHDGLIGVSNRPITLNGQQAAEKKALLNNNLFTPSSLTALDASLATQPYVDRLVKQTLGVTDILYNICEYTNTIPGYEALINKKKDIILVTEPSKEMLALAASKGVELELTPFAKEGFVFLLNESNPVDTLSVQQLKDIYAGKITNWKEVGGSDSPILAYQRNESSGSQTIMENVFMKDEQLMTPLTERRVMTMEGLVDVIAEFSGEINHSIGYSVYYYATQMYGNDMVKLVKVDGVLPDSATIADNTYPVVVNYYIVTRKGDETPFAMQMKDYILSPAGQELLTEVGLVPIM